MNDRSVPEKHQPHRDSDVEAWIKRCRDIYELHSSSWNALNYLLDDYRARADFGKFLDSYDDYRARADFEKFLDSYVDGTW